ncbi:hypothetical protein AVEN_112421-1 [Araneus ventricosus]|uniref:Uncharacterized protein n=1 Tax=Araneus ventricosus TaxID=182803 RepID=A0A4Y2TIU1_ARAVE|nr:hypothetical protein AVEN_112421-1 [Araneus ventricosus]
MGLIALINIFYLRNSFNLFSSLNPSPTVSRDNFPPTPLASVQDSIVEKVRDPFGDCGAKKGSPRQSWKVDSVAEVLVEKLVLDYCSEVCAVNLRVMYTVAIGIVTKVQL